DHLPRAVIGHLSAALGTHDGDVAGCVKVLGARRMPQREYRRMLDQPDLVAGVGRAVERERLHRLQGRQVGPPTKRAQLWCGWGVAIAGGAHSTTLTSGCVDSARYSRSSCSRESTRTTTVTLR